MSIRVHSAISCSLPPRPHKLHPVPTNITSSSSSSSCRCCHLLPPPPPPPGEGPNHQPSDHGVSAVQTDVHGSSIHFGSSPLPRPTTTDKEIPPFLPFFPFALPRSMSTRLLCVLRSTSFSPGQKFAFFLDEKGRKKKTLGEFKLRSSIPIPESLYMAAVCVRV